MLARRWIDRKPEIIGQNAKLSSQAAHPFGPENVGWIVFLPIDRSRREQRRRAGQHRRLLFI